MKRLAALLSRSILPLLVLAGCGAGDAEWRGTIADSAGVQIVSNLGGGVWPPGGGWTFEEDLRIGTISGEPEYQFSMIVGIDVDADGRIYVLDQQARQVRVFDPEGRFLRMVGRSGSGPGELSQGAVGVFVRPDGGIIVPDLMNQRINVYSALGEPEPSVPLPFGEGVAALWLKGADQNLYQQSMVVPGMGAAPLNVILRRDPHGAVLDTVLALPPSEAMSFGPGEQRVRLFAPEARWTIDADGRLVHGISSEYRLQVVSADGSLERIIEKPFTARAVTPGDREEFLRELRVLFEREGVPPQAVQGVLGSISFADQYPAYAGLRGGPEGTVWVQSILTPDDARSGGGIFDLQDLGSRSWDVFDRDGRFLGAVAMPPRFTPMLILDDRIYGVIRDELNVQYVTRLRLHR